ncbi:MAG: hypothetical protein ACOC8K_00360 [Gemmatimonadota bacterium]
MDDVAAESARSENAELSYENALMIIEEFEEVVDELEEGGERTAEQEAQAAELVERLLSSLDDLPLSSEMARERIENVESWAELLVSEGGEADPGPGSIPSLLRDALAELRGFLEYEMTT